MKRSLLWMVCALFAVAEFASAGGPCSGVRGGCGRSRARTSSRSSSGGTVHVGSYTRRDGTRVRAHTRRAPCSGCGSSDSTSSRPARTTARTTARTRSWGGTGSADDDDLTVDELVGAEQDEEDVRRFAPPPVDPPKKKLAAQFKVYYVNGDVGEIVSYEEVADGYRVTRTSGGTSLLAKQSIEKFEPLVEEAEVVPSTSEELVARFRLFYKNGNVTEIAAYTEDEETYWTTRMSGGRIRIPKNEVEKIEPIPGVEDGTSRSSHRPSLAA